MAMTFTPPPLAAAAAAGPPGPEAPPTPEASLGASEGGEERTESWVLSGMELRGRILGSCFMKASTAGLREEVEEEEGGGGASREEGLAAADFSPDGSFSEEDEESPRSLF